MPAKTVPFLASTAPEMYYAIVDLLEAVAVANPDPSMWPAELRNAVYDARNVLTKAEGR